MPFKLLVAVKDYPNLNGSAALMYVHTRNKQYIKSGMSVTVLNFSAKDEYCIDGIQVIPLKVYQNNNEDYDALICHAANLRNHFRFLQRYEERFSKIIFFFHGHEVLHINKTYSKPYPYMRKGIFKYCIQNIYDSFKLFVWRCYLPKISYKSHFVFVSKWMLDEFLKSTKIDFHSIEDKCTITYNCIGKEFENAIYDSAPNKKFDFVTIRGNLDGSKYCVDVVNNLAKANPHFSFLLVGKGKFFEHYTKAENIIWRNTHLNHAQIVEVLQTARCALMPTRTDAQGVMTCEMASIGMPVITSDIPVCYEVFDGFENIAMIDNDDLSVDLDLVLQKLENGLPYAKNEKYYNENTSEKEIDMIKEIMLPKQEKAVLPKSRAGGG